MFIPTPNNKGRSALGEAIAHRNLEAAKVLIARLDPAPVMDRRTICLTWDLLEMADTWPEELVTILKLLEESPAVIQPRRGVTGEFDTANEDFFNRK